MKDFLIIHALDEEEPDYTFCEDYNEMVELIEDNNMIFSKRYKVLKAMKIGTIQQYDDLISPEK